MTNDAGVPGAPRFDVVLRGYDRRQVDEHVDRLQRVLSRMRADLEIVRSQPMPAVTPAPRPADGPRPRPTPRPRSGPPAPPDTIGNFTDRMESILAEAEAEAAEIRRNAHVVARSETDGARAQVADLLRQRDAVLGELTRMRAQLEGMLAAPTAQMAAYEPAARPPVGRSESETTPSRTAAPTRPASSDRPVRPPSSANGASVPAVRPSGAGSAQAGSSTSAADSPARPGPSVPASADGGAAGSGSSRPGGPAQPQQSPSSPSGSGTPSTGGGVPGPPDSAEQTTAEQALGAQPEQATTAQAVAPPVHPERAAGKAAHRLPTGAYPAVTEQSSLRPRTEPGIEPADLFRPRTEDRTPDPRPSETHRPETHRPEARPAEPRTTAVPQQPAAEKPVPGGDRTALVPTVTARDERPTGTPGGADATTMVGAVRPQDATVLAPVPGAVTRPVPRDGKPDGNGRPGFPSRSA